MVVPEWQRYSNTKLFLWGCQVLLAAAPYPPSEIAPWMVHALTGGGKEGKEGKEGLYQARTSSTQAKRSQQEAGVQDRISAFQTSVVSQVFSWHRSHWLQCTNADLHPPMNMRLGEERDRVMVHKNLMGKGSEGEQDEDKRGREGETWSWDSGNTNCNAQLWEND